MKTTFTRFLVASAFVLLCAAVSPATAQVPPPPLDENFLLNPSCDNNDFDGWTVIGGTGTYGWVAAWNQWITSLDAVEMNQTVDFVASGLPASVLDGSFGTLYLSAAGSVKCPWPAGSNGRAYITVEVLDAADAVLQTVSLLDTTYSAVTTGEIPMRIYSLRTALPVGARKARFSFGGYSSQPWRGAYGPVFDDMWLGISMSADLPNRQVLLLPQGSGQVSADRTLTAPGDTVTFRLTPDQGFGVDSFMVEKISSGQGRVALLTDSSFIMPYGYTVRLIGYFSERPYNQNLLLNPSCDNSDFAYWTPTLVGDTGWIALNSNWQASFRIQTMSQMVDLQEAGFTATELDASPYLSAAGSVLCPNAGGGEGLAKIYVEMLNASDSVLDMLMVIDIIYAQWNGGDIPMNIYVRQEILPVGVRKLRFVFEGKDSRYWAGHYGPVFDDMWLSLDAVAGIPVKRVSWDTIPGGILYADHYTANPGDTVRIFAAPHVGFVMDTLMVNKVNGGPITINADSTFIMPYGYHVQLSAQFTAISSIRETRDVTYKLWTEPGTIHLRGSNNEQVTVYTATGVLVYRGLGDIALRLPQGMYIMTIGQSVEKVALK